MTRLPLLFALVLSACSTVSQATAPLDAYTLQPLPAAEGHRGSGHLVVELPTVSGELETDRILIKPNPLQAAYLPKGRWVDPLPQLEQSLLVASLQNAGHFRLVSRDAAGLVPDHVALVEINAFEAEAPAAPRQPTPVHVGLTVSLLDARDNRLLATRRFDVTEMAEASDTLSLVTAFDLANQQVMAQTVLWLNKIAR